MGPTGSLGLPRAPRGGGAAASGGGGRRQALIYPRDFLIFRKIDFLMNLWVWDHFGPFLDILGLLGEQFFSIKGSRGWQPNPRTPRNPFFFNLG